MSVKSKSLKVALCLTGVFILLALLGGCLWFQTRNDSRYLPKNADLTVAHLTDLHLSSKGNLKETPWTHKIVINGYKLHKPCTGKSFELLEKAITVINEKIKPDIVVITGDILNRGDDTEALKKGHEVLAKLKCPVIIAKGDHDIASKPKNKSAFESVFGELDGVLSVKDFPFFYIPYESDDGTFERLKKAIDDSSPKSEIKFLCMHRMLYASWLMNKLSKKYCPTLLSPKRKMIIDMLEKSSGKWIVLCGHSHTNHEETVNNITELCTSSLAEYPHEFRIIKVKDGKIYTRIVKLDEYKDD
jgi:predicted MPP superfamily phosphohydrolase